MYIYFDITVCDEGKGTVTSIKPVRMPAIKQGYISLRTFLIGLDEPTFWSIYNAIHEIEYTFGVLKTDFDLRPVYYKTDEDPLTHMHLELLAYWLVATIRYQLKLQEVSSNWREIVRKNL